jgi:hypothetical protein
MMDNNGVVCTALQFGGVAMKTLLSVFIALSVFVAVAGSAILVVESINSAHGDRYSAEVWDQLDRERY